MKLTKKQRSELDSILYDLNRVQKYILKNDTIIANKCTITSMPENTYINKKTGETAIVFNKHVGSELCYLANSISKLNNLLNAE